MKLGRAIAALFGARPATAAAPAGTYACFVREIAFLKGERAGESEVLTDGELEYDIITHLNLLWQYQDGESVHNGQPLTIDYRPDGTEQLVARQPESGLVIRVSLGPEPMRFAALHPNSAFNGVCYFQPRVPQ